MALQTEEKHVLLVDDDRFFRSLFVLMLGQTGYPLAKIWEAADGASALEICRTRPLDLIFCDINLSNSFNENGLEIVPALRIIHPVIPIFMVSSLNQEDVVRQAHDVGATGHLLKPISLRILKRVLASNLPPAPTTSIHGWAAGSPR